MIAVVFGAALFAVFAGAFVVRAVRRLPADLEAADFTVDELRPKVER